MGFLGFSSPCHTLFYTVEKVNDIDGDGLDNGTVAGTQDRYLLAGEDLAAVLRQLGSAVHPAPNGTPEYPCVLNLNSDRLAGPRMPHLIKAADRAWQMAGKSAGIQRNLLLPVSYARITGLTGMERFLTDHVKNTINEVLRVAQRPFQTGHFLCCLGKRAAYSHLAPSKIWLTLLELGVPTGPTALGTCIWSDHRADSTDNQCLPIHRRFLTLC